MNNHVLITRPTEDAENISKLVKQRGFQVTCEPFLEISIMDKPLNDLDMFGGVIFTSRNGVRAFCKNTTNRYLTAWTVGDSTRDLAIEMGFKDVQSAAGDLEALEVLLDDEFCEDELLYVRAQHVSRDFERDGVREIILYDAEIKREISPDIQNLIKEGTLSHVLFFSKRTAEGFVKLAKAHQLEAGLSETKALCLGASMVESLSVLPWKAVEVAEKPNRDSLLAILG